MRRTLALALAATGLVVAAWTPAATEAGGPTNTQGDQSTLERLERVARVSFHDETGKVRFVGTVPGRPIARPLGLSSSATAAQVARAFFVSYGAVFGIRDQARELRVTATQAGTAGRSAVRFQQLLDDVPVVGGEFVVNLDAARNVLSVSGEALPAAAVAATPRVGSAAAREAAVAAVAKARRVAPFRLEATQPTLWIYDARILGGPGPERPTLVWRLDVRSTEGLPIDELVLVDAQLGSVALRIDQIEHAKNRQVCDGANTAAQYPCTVPVRSEGGAPHLVQDVNDAYDFAGDTYDLFLGLGRDSLDGAGMTLKSTVRHCPTPAECPYGNAFWDGEQMVYGQGFAAADDVVGHELTHGVTEHSARLFYYYQSGAINESLSDVFGEFVDLTNGAGTDTAATRWQLGEDIPLFGAIRDMENPTLFGDPDRMTSPRYTADPTEEDAGGVHRNSGVNNKAAFLMTDGGTFNGRTVTALGIPKVSRIYYTALTTMLTSASDYADLASALQQACNNLVGSSGITTGDCVEVTDAVAAVEMSTDPPAALAPEAPVCGSGPVPGDLFFDNLENTGSGNWTAQSDWYYPQSGNPYNFDATYATSGSQNLWGYDRPTTGDYSISMNSSVAIPAGLTTYLRFNHAYGFEDDAGHAYDGGVLEYSTNNGASWSDLGPLLTDGGYNGTITTSFDNPLKGRNAFVRESNGYKSSRANLSSLAGQSVRIRFRIGTDFIVDDYGWFIDDIRIYTCGPMLAPTAATQAASNVTTSGATLNGMVDPNGTATSYQFEFGPTAAYGSFAPAGPASVGAGSDPIAVTQTIGGLAAATTYHYRVVAVRGATRVNGADQTFTTTSPPPPPVLPPGCTIAGTAGNDVLVGTAGADVICGLGGSDTIRGLGGSDTLKGAGGNDRLIGGAGADILLGGTRCGYPHRRSSG